jgi:hypothetical protein
MMEITGANCYVAEAGQSMKGIGNGESLSAIALLVDHGGCSVSFHASKIPAHRCAWEGQEQSRV